VEKPSVTNERLGAMAEMALLRGDFRAELSSLRTSIVALRVTARVIGGAVMVAETGTIAALLIVG
jgi:hypothetical protein